MTRKTAAQLQGLTKARLKRLGHEPPLEPPWHTTRSEALKETQGALESALKELEAEKTIRQNQDKKMNNLLQKATRGFDELNNCSDSLTETQGALAEISKRFSKQENRKEKLEKRLRASNARNSRLHTTKSRLLEENKVSNMNTNTNTKLTVDNGELKQAADWHHEEARVLRTQIGAVREAEVTVCQKLEEEIIEHMKTKSLLFMKEREAEQLAGQLKKMKTKERRLRQKIDIVLRTKNIFRLRALRFASKLSMLEIYKKTVQTALQFIEKGTYTPSVRSFIRQIVILNCPMSSIGPIIDGFYQKMIKPLPNPAKRLTKISLQPCTVARIVGEGGVAADIQMALEFLRTPGSDGTTNRSKNFEAMHVNLHAPETYANPHDLKPTTRLMEVRMSANHRTETQIEGDLACIKQKVEMLYRSPLRAITETVNQPFNMRYLWTKYAGTHSDHANDQKLKHKKLGMMKQEQCKLALAERDLYTMPAEQRGDIFGSAESSLIAFLGGQEAWDALKPEVQQMHMEKMIENVLTDMVAKKELDIREEEDLRAISIWIWAGCQMHKEMNAVKGGCARAKKIWATLGVAPIPLANKDNAAILAAVVEGLAEAAAAAHANASTVGGGEKLTGLCGAWLNHREDKKGLHDLFRDIFKTKFGFILTFPDTSNTQFGSHLEAAAELLERLEFYLEFIEIVRDAKEKGTLNHLEENILNGLLDGPTRTELAVMTLYRELISVPYISAVRGPGLEANNAMDMGPLHAKVIEKICKLIENPELVLSPNANPRLTTLNGSETWDRPGAVAAVHRLAPELPFFQEIFVAFMEGALETWKRFSAEFEEDGIIAGLTSEEKKAYWMPATNDANEGALGEYHSFARRYPTGGLELFNALRKYKRNNTEDFIHYALTTDGDRAFLRQEARARLDAKLDQKQRMAIAGQILAETAEKRRKRRLRQTKKSKKQEHLATVKFELDEAKLNTMMLVALNEQIAKYKAFEKQSVLQFHLLPRLPSTTKPYQVP